MAHFVQGLAALVLILVSAGGANGGPFSHRQHLELKLACATCHQTATQSTKAADNLLPTQTVCLSCHKAGETSIKAPSKRTVDLFNHAVHARMGNLAPAFRAAMQGGSWLGGKAEGEALLPYLDTKNGCAACHKGIEQSENVAAAPAHFPHMADCLTCHTPIDPPFSCEKCHLEPQKLKPASHTPGYIDEHNRMKGKLDKETCAVCHGREFRCLGCH